MHNAECILISSVQCIKALLCHFVDYCLLLVGWGHTLQHLYSHLPNMLTDSLTAKGVGVFTLTLTVNFILGGICHQ